MLLGMKESYEEGDSDSILALSLAGDIARCRPKRRQGYRWAGLLRVEEPAHAEKQHAREPGDLWSASGRKATRSVREGAKPHGGRARSRGVGPRHTQSRAAHNKHMFLEATLDVEGCANYY